MSFNDKTLLFLMWLPTWQDGFQNHNNNHNILHLQMYMYLFFCGHWGRRSHCSRFIWRSLLSCKHGKWVKAIKSISFSLNQTQWICSKWCFGCAGRCSIQLLKRAFNTLQKKREIFELTLLLHTSNIIAQISFCCINFQGFKKRNYMKKQFKIRSIHPAKQISQLGFSWREKPNCTIKYNLAIEWRMENYIAILRNESCIKRRETQQRNYLRQLKLL